MLQLSKIFWNICRLKSKPQDFPGRASLLLIVVLAGIVIDSFSSSILIPSLSGLEVVQIIVLYNLVLLASVYILLKLVGFAERSIQTITAIAGSGLFISLVLLPALLVLNTANEASKSFVLLILVDNIWRISVNAHIFRHALSINKLMAMILSVSYLLLGFLVADILLQQQAP